MIRIPEAREGGGKRSRGYETEGKGVMGQGEGRELGKNWGIEWEERSNVRTREKIKKGGVIL